MSTKPAQASDTPSTRPPLALAPSTSNRYTSTTWTWSNAPRVWAMKIVARNVATIQPDQTSADLCRDMLGPPLPPLTRLVDAVPDAGLGDDDLRTGRVELDLAPKVGDVHAQVLLRAPEFATPHGVEDLLVRERPASRGEQRRENLPLDRREMDLRPVARHAAVHRVDEQTADRHRAGGSGGGEGAGAANLSLGARGELGNAERLRHVVVRPGVQQIDFFVLRVARRQDDDRHRGTPPDLAAYINAGHVRQPEIEHHEVGPPRGRRIDAGGSVRRFVDARGAANLRLVVDHENDVGVGHADRITAEQTDSLAELLQQGRASQPRPHR